MISAQWFSNVLADTNTAKWLYIRCASNSGSSIGPVFCSMGWGSLNSNVGVWINGPAGTITSVEFNGAGFSRTHFKAW